MSTKILQVLLVLGLFLTACTPEIVASPTATWTSTPKPIETNTPLPSPTPLPPVLTVNTETACHAGPGTLYDPVATLIVGDLAQVIGKDAEGNYWIVKNPNGDGECWVESQSVTVIGETSALASVPPPPTPAPVKPSAPTNIAATITCSWSGGWKRVTRNKFQNYMEVVITLTWEHDSKNTDGYNIYKEGKLAGTIDATTHTYGDWFVQPLNTPVSHFHYAIEAFGSMGTSERVEFLFDQTCSSLEVEIR